MNKNYIVSGAILLAVLGYAVYHYQNTSSDVVATGGTTGGTSIPVETTNPNAIGGTQTTPTPSTPSTPAPQKYKDGTYTATGTYQAPSGTESIGVTLVLKNGIITDATVVGNAQRGDSREYQARFIVGFKTQVVGKSIDNVSLTRVSGASLTPIGWNNAVSQIAAQAKA